MLLAVFFAAPLRDGFFAVLDIYKSFKWNAGVRLKSSYCV
ncbi:hypothetical protein RGAI101_285 [Roseobacter sp. GAI101]|nr:hypothetical protein RGAI101_285 [Roseobacter sp. GAI101]